VQFTEQSSSGNPLVTGLPYRSAEVEDLQRPRPEFLLLLKEGESNYGEVVCMTEPTPDSVPGQGFANRFVEGDTDVHSVDHPEFGKTAGDTQVIEDRDNGEIKTHGGIRVLAVKHRSAEPPRAHGGWHDRLRLHPAHRRCRVHRRHRWRECGRLPRRRHRRDLSAGG